MHNWWYIVGCFGHAVRDCGEAVKKKRKKKRNVNLKEPPPCKSSLRQNNSALNAPLKQTVYFPVATLRICLMSSHNCNVMNANPPSFGHFSACSILVQFKATGKYSITNNRLHMIHSLKIEKSFKKKYRSELLLSSCTEWNQHVPLCEQSIRWYKRRWSRSI